MRKAVRLVLVLACGALAAAPAPGAAAPRATVAGVVDGDTIRVETAGRTATVDLLGVRAASGCGTDGAAALRALLPAGAKVRLVRDGVRGAAYVFRGSTFVNDELLGLGVARAGGLRGLRRARELRATARWARRVRLGIWSCTPAADAPAPPASSDALAEIDRYVRGHRFSVTEEGGSGADAYRIEMDANFCPDGRLVVAVRFTGSDGTQDGGRTTGSWKLLGVAHSEGQAFLGRFETELPDGEEEPERSELFVGRLADGTPVVGDGEEQRTATRAPADAC